VLVCELQVVHGGDDHKTPDPPVEVQEPRDPLDFPAEIHGGQGPDSVSAGYPQWSSVMF